MISQANSQIIGFFAACQISEDGLVKKTFGCDVSRVSLGTYDVTLPEGAGLAADETYLYVTPRQLGPFPSLQPAFPTVTDVDAFTKRVIMRDSVDALSDHGFTAVLFRTPTQLG